MADEPNQRRKSIKVASQTQGVGKKRKRAAKLKGNEKFCFVITKNNSNSLADDLYACGRIADLTRVYH